MSKIGLIIKREYTTRVRKKSFLVMTILGPLLFAILIFAPIVLANTGGQVRRVVVVDATHVFCGVLKSGQYVRYDYGYCNFDSSQVRSIFKDSSKVSVLFIPPSSAIATDIQLMLYSKTDPGDNVLSEIETQMNNIIERMKLQKQNLDPNIVEAVKTNVKIDNTVNNAITDTDYNMVLGYASSFLIYIFIFLYSVQVMRGVMEEKINRIVEIIISSVKPFQLMMGKVIGVGLVGLTQFLIWVIISMAVFSFGSSYLQKQEVSPQNAITTEQTMKKGMPQQAQQMMAHRGISKDEAMSKLDSIDESLRSTNWVLVIGCFLFYFLGGYLLYSSLFAAIGSAVDQETETQQFIMPVTAPLILSIIVMQNIIRDPHSSIAFWFSLIPFTSPVAMMARVPFGLPVWQLLLSMSVLILFIFGTIWLAGRIYRVGLLMYGKKITYKELGKWLFYK
jgi:ABC-2 type transport system permease protein